MNVPSINSVEADLTVFEALTPQERAFAFLYVTIYDYAQAAEEVGYARSSGFRLINKPLLKRFINHLQQDHEQYMLIDKAFVQAKLLEHLPKFEGKEPIPIVDRDGNERTAHVYDATALMSMFNLMGKHAGYMAEKSNRAVHIEIDFDRMGVDPPKKVGITIEGESNETPE